MRSAAAIVNRFIDHPTQDWLARALPAELHATAYQPPADCADVAVILRHVWLHAHGRGERYRGWRVGYLAHESRRQRIARVRQIMAELNTPDAHQMVNAYTDDRGRPIRSFTQLEPLLHPGDILVWAHHERGQPTAPRAGGHTQTILDVYRSGNSIEMISVLQGNQPIFEDQARDIQAYLGTRGPTQPMRDTGGGRIEVNRLNNEPPQASQGTQVPRCAAA